MAWNYEETQMLHMPSEYQWIKNKSWRFWLFLLKVHSLSSLILSFPLILKQEWKWEFLFWNNQIVLKQSKDQYYSKIEVPLNFFYHDYLNDVQSLFQLIQNRQANSQSNIKTKVLKWQISKFISSLIKDSSKTFEVKLFFSHCKTSIEKYIS